MIPEELKYTKEHEWVKVEGNVATVGITDHAQSELGDITFVELPSAGRDVSASESFAAIESVKAASDVYAPVSGKVTEVNESLEDAPEAVNQSAYSKGWICKIEMSDASEVEGLMNSDAYTKLLEENK